MNFIFLIIPALAVIAVYYSEGATRYKPHSTGVVLITGASTGIGRHAAEFLASKHNLTVLAGVRKESDAESIRSMNLTNLHPILIDVVDHDSCVHAIDEIKSLMASSGLPFIGLVNNAGISFKMPIEYQDIAHARSIFDTNFFGMMDLTQLSLPLLRESKGRVIMISSVAGLIARPYSSIYSASKYAMEAFSDALRREVAHFGVSVSVVEPAFVKTAIVQTANDALDKAAAKLSPEQLSRYDFFSADYREKTYKKTFAKGDTPMVTTLAIRHALMAIHPQTRYVVANVGGIPGYLVGWMVWLLPDRITDIVIKFMN